MRGEVLKEKQRLKTSHLKPAIRLPQSKRRRGNFALDAEAGGCTDGQHRKRAQAKISKLDTALLYSFPHTCKHQTCQHAAKKTKQVL